MRYIDLSLRDYVDKVATKAMPGGGSVAAVCGALAVSLLIKALLISRKKINKELTQLMRRFLELIDEDVKNFKAGPKEATTTLIELCKISGLALRLYSQILKNSKLILRGDIEMAKGLLNASFNSARLNIEINLKSVEDKKFIENTKKTMNFLSRETSRCLQSF